MTPTATRRLTAKDLEPINARLEACTPEEVLQWTHQTFGKRAAVMSAMQKAGCVVCHLVSVLGIGGDVPILFVDTGVNFRETIDTVDRIGREYKLRMISLHPKRTMAEQCAAEGVLYLTKEGQERCCHLRKHEPLEQLKGQYDALIASLQRSSGGRRGAVPILALDTELNLIRVHPLARWGNEVVEQYIKHHKVIYNPLHDQGYPTISCDRCTSPVVEGEEERAGRWRHLANAVQYCNINPTDRKKKADAPEPSVELDAATAERILAL